MADQKFPQLSDYSPDELIFMADEHDDQAFAVVFGNHPAMINEGDFFEIITGINDPFANMAFGMNVRDAENRVWSITTKLKDLKVPGYFWVGPCTEPANLEELLLQNGWTYLASPPAMAVDLSELGEAPAVDGLELRRVVTNEEYAQWLEAVAAGFILPLNVAQLFQTPKDDSVRFYTALLDGQPIGTAAMVILKGVPGIYCVSTLPEFRRRGIGALLTTLPLLDARAEGYRMATLQSSSMGYPIYTKLGFREVCKLKMFGFGL